MNVFIHLPPSRHSYSEISLVNVSFYKNRQTGKWQIYSKGDLGRDNDGTKIIPLKCMRACV